jgi:AraC family transcriptional activator of mtrCDE
MPVRRRARRIVQERDAPIPTSCPVPMSSGENLAALLATFGSSTPPFTLLRVPAAMRMATPQVDSVVALLVLSGTMHLHIAGAAPRIVKQGRLVLLPSGSIASLSPGADASVTLSSSDCLASRNGWMLADGTRGRAAALVVGAGRIAGSSPEALKELTISAVTKCAIGKRLLIMLRNECEERGQAALANALMHACVIQGMRRAIARAPDPLPSAGGRGLLAGAIAAIRSDPGEAHSVERLAVRAGMSRSSFIRHFKRIMRIGPAEYVQKVRLEEAHAMLLASDLPIAAISKQSGFSSRSHFSRVFRAEFGSDPSSYRTRNRADRT